MMNKMVLKKYSIPIFIALLMLTACTKPPVNSSSNQVMSKQAISGAVIKGPITNASVKIFALDEKGEIKGEVIETVTTDANGHWSLTAVIGRDAHLIVASGGSFMDESDSETDISKKRKITLQPSEQLFGILPGNATSGVVTFTTHAIYEQIKRHIKEGGTFQEAFLRTQIRVSKVLGFNPFTVIPANPTSPEESAANSQLTYALIAGGQANMMNSLAIALGREKMDYEIIQAFSNDFNDCVLNADDKGGIIPVGDVDTGVVMVGQTMNLHQQIERFRNNNYRHYSSLPLPSFSETELCNRALDIAPPTQEIFVLAEDSQAASTDVEKVTGVGDATMKSYFDQVNGNKLVINFKKNYAAETDTYGTEITFKLNTVSAGKYTTSSGVYADYVKNGIAYDSADAENAWGTVEITDYNDVNGYIVGRYRFQLCPAAGGCTDGSNIAEISGYFSVIREVDYVNTSQGTSASPHVITTMPYTTDNSHIVSDISHSFYKISVPSDAGMVRIELSELSDDVDLFVYDDAGFSTPVCTSNNVGIKNELCLAEFPLGFAFVKVVNLGGGRDASFNLNVTTVDTYFSKKVNALSSIIYTPSINNVMLQYYDPRMADNKFKVKLQIPNNSETRVDILTISFNELQPGLYDLGTQANAEYRADDISYDIKDELSSGSVTIDGINNETGIMTGYYAMTLCREKLDCSLPENKKSLVGRFKLPIDAGIRYESEGTLVNQISLPGTTYTSKTAYDGRLHSVKAGQSSYYKFSALTAETQYIIKISQMTDQLSLALDSNNDFINTLCESSNTEVSEIICTVNGTDASSVFMRIDYLNEGDGDVFHIELMRENFTVSTDNGVTSEAFVDGNVNVSVRAVYDNTLDSENRMKIRLSANDYRLNLRLADISAAIYNINKSSSANLLHEGVAYFANSGTITVNHFGKVGELISGTYNLFMCPENMVCNAKTLKNFQGDFEIVRDVDRDFESQGDINAPYMIQPLIDFSEKYTVSSVNPHSFYQAVIIPDLDYIFSLNDIKGNVRVELFLDDSYSSPIVTSLSCIEASNGNDSIVCSFKSPGVSVVYIKVTLVSGIGSSYLFDVASNNFSIVIDGGETSSFDESLNVLGIKNVLVSTTSIDDFSYLFDGLKFQANWNGYKYETALIISGLSGVSAGGNSYSIKEISSITLEHGGRYYYNSDELPSGELNFNVYGFEGASAITGSYAFTLCNATSSCSVVGSTTAITGTFAFIPSTVGYDFFSEGYVMIPMLINNSMNTDERYVASGVESYYMFENFEGTDASAIEFIASDAIKIELSTSSFLAPDIICTIYDINGGACDNSYIFSEIIYIRATYNGIESGSSFQIFLP